MKIFLYQHSAFFLLFVFSCSLLFADRKEKFPVLEAARWMVENELLPQKGLENEAVLDVMKRIPRHRFVAPINRQIAYRDQAIEIGEAQTISPPYVVAYMTEQLQPKPTDKVLEIGTGSGYQAAVLGLLVDKVYTIEIVETLGKRAATLLEELGLDNVSVRVGDGYKGWPEAAPFDSIIVTCSPESVPQPLIDQLREGGRMIIPLGERYQQTFYLCKKVDGKLVRERLTPSLFVPMTGRAEEERRVKPDPKNPSLVGGGFEEARSDGSPVGWHYARNVQILAYEPDIKPVETAGIPEGKQFARFVNRADDAPVGQTPKPFVPGQAAQVLQGFAVDGRELKAIVVEYSMRGRNIVPQERFQTPSAVMMFYDDSRKLIGEVQLGRCNRSFPWRRIVQEIPLSSRVREAVLLIGLPLATGELDVDHVVVRKVDP